MRNLRTLPDASAERKPRLHIHADALLLRREAAATMLGVSARTLDRWVEAGLVRRLNAPGMNKRAIGLFAVDDLREFVERLRRQTAKPLHGENFPKPFRSATGRVE